MAHLTQEYSKHLELTILVTLLFLMESEYNNTILFVILILIAITFLSVNGIQL